MDGTITILVDNRAEEPFMDEHGFALLLETQGKKILFDTGQGEALFCNAEKMGLSLVDLDILILSHGHYDHGGNVAKILNLNPSIQFYGHPNCLSSRWSIPSGKVAKAIDLSKEDKNAISTLSPDRLHWCTGPTEIIPDIWLTGPIPRKSPFEDVGGAFYIDAEGQTPDLIPDDMALWLGAESQMMICGCCHSGIQNSIDHIMSFSNSLRVKSLLGGLHLINASEERLIKTIAFLNDVMIKKVFPGHCTGETGMELFREQLEAEVQVAEVGLQIKL